MPKSMGDRLKEYESVSENILTPRLPIAVRLDGNSFSKWTKIMKLEKPFDERMVVWMGAACETLLNYCSGCEIVYTQSDEITLILRNDQNYDTEPFLSNRTQKIASLLASVCSVAFNDSVRKTVPDAPVAHFDARVYVIPPSEINNVFLWRQRDAFKNCISSFAYWKLSKKLGKETAMKMIHGKTVSERQEIIFQELGINSNDIPTKFKRGFCVYKTQLTPLLSEVMPKDKFEKMLEAGKITKDQTTIRSKTVHDYEIPLFNENRDWIESFYYKADKKEKEKE